MKVMAEISLYPLRRQELSSPIRQFCGDLAKSGLNVETGRMSTSISGEVDRVFDALKTAMVSIAQAHEVVLIAKVSNACPQKAGHEGQCPQLL